MYLCEVALRHPPPHVIGAINIPTCEEVTFDGDFVFVHNSANESGGEINAEGSITT